MSGTELDPQEDQEQLDLLQVIDDLKKNTVPRDKYDGVINENRKLLQIIVDGSSSDEEIEETPIDIKALRKELFSGDKELNNLEYVEKILQLRKAILDGGGNDPFLPTGSHAHISRETIEKAENLGKVLQECVDFAKGDSGIFTAELQRRTNETPNYRR